ncbi:MAG: hypothetical protein U1F57_00875 [bacterium]
MRKALFLFTPLFLILVMKSAFALDPVAPKQDRAFGFLTVQSPLPSDICEIKSLKLKQKEPFELNFHPDELMKVPVGDYQLKVKMQEVEWTSRVTVHPTEMTQVFVPGFGNLKVIAPQPAKTTVEVFSKDGKLLRTFPADQIKTFPVGDYTVVVKLPAEQVPNRVETVTPEGVKNNVTLVANETRRLVVYK